MFARDKGSIIQISRYQTKIFKYPKELFRIVISSSITLNNYFASKWKTKYNTENSNNINGQPNF